MHTTKSLLVARVAHGAPPRCGARVRFLLPAVRRRGATHLITVRRAGGSWLQGVSGFLAFSNFGAPMSLSQVIVITLAHGDRVGIRYLDNGVKVYYAPHVPFVQGVAFPAFVDFMPLFRSIVLREGVTIVHGHQVLCDITSDACGAD
jgi:hypothetical protein